MYCELFLIEVVHYKQGCNEVSCNTHKSFTVTMKFVKLRIQFAKSIAKMQAEVIYVCLLARISVLTRYGQNSSGTKLHFGKITRSELYCIRCEELSLANYGF